MITDNNEIRRFSAKSRKAKLLASVAGVVAGALASTAMAQSDGPEAPLRMKSNYFGYAASVSPRFSYTDNLNLRPDGLEQDEFIFSTLFNASAIYSGNRLTAVLDGDIDLSYLTEQSDVVVNQRVGAAATVTLADNLAYLDFSGATARQLIGENARFSSNANAARNQRADVHSFSASPYLNRRFSDESAAELRYRYSKEFVDDSRVDGNRFNNFINDSQTQEVGASYFSGRKFDRLQFTLTAYGNRTTEDGSDVVPAFTFEQGTVKGEAKFAVTERYALSGAIGYDDVNIEDLAAIFPTADLSGVFWRAGVSARPGRKTDIRVEYGRRYGDDFIDADLRYNVSDTILFSAGANRTFQTRSQAVGTQFRARQRSVLDFAERLREGDTLSASEVVQSANRIVGGGTVNAQTFGLGVTDRAYAQLSGLFGRTSVSATASYNDTDFGYRVIESINGNLGVQRQVSRRMSAYGDLFYRRSDTTIDPALCVATPLVFGVDANDPMIIPALECLLLAASNGVSDTVGGRLGVSYRMMKNISVFGEIAHTQRFSDIASLEYGENAFSAGLTLDF